MAIAVISWVAVALLCYSELWSGVAAETCTISGTACQCTLADGRTLDITGISTSPNFKSFPDKLGEGYTYAYGPCGDVLNQGDDCVPANDAASCQFAGDTWNNLGRTQQLSIDVDTSSNPTKSTWSYSGGTQDRETTVVITCDQSQTPGSIVDDGEHPTLTYNFLVTSSYGCLNGGGGNPTTQPNPGTTHNGPLRKSGGISPGSVCVIIFFVVAIMYLVGGVLVMRFRSGAQGLEMVPNRELWMSVPGLIKDGVLFAVSPCRKGEAREGYEKL